MSTSSEPNEEPTPESPLITRQQDGEPQRQHESKMRWHLFSPIALCVWLGYISAYIFVLEKAVRNAPHDIGKSSFYDLLASLMHTFFSQFHTSITTLYLVRVAASAFQGDEAADCTWGELFWMSDKSWSSFPQLVHAVTTIIGKGIAVSLTFIVFASTSLVAIATPAIFLHAYPLGTVNTTSSFPITPHGIFSSKAILGVDRDTEIGTGMGSWATGLSVFDAYEFSIYSADILSQGNLSDFFFSDDLGGADANRTGLHLQGGCSPFPDASTAIDQDPALLPIYCKSLPPNRDQKMNINVSFGTAKVTYSFCTYPPALTVPSGPDSNATAYIFLQSHNGTAATTGMVKCQSNFSMGTAFLSGMDLTYTSFVKNVPYKPVQDVGLADPLSAVLAGMVNTSVGKDTLEGSSTLIKQLGYNATVGNSNSLVFIQPSLDIFAERIWLGVAHMVVGIGLLSSSSDTRNVTIPTLARTRSKPYISGLIALLTSWLCGLIFVSIIGYRPSIEPRLGSLTTAIRLQEIYALPKAGDESSQKQFDLIDFSDPNWLTKKVGARRG
ncbi:hypothetical protein BU17DRAFT_93109 [Hysterangium stoloniferum]|nr:hypothetical protein BU17DRAFT_93109 [Hysterangium stoloniferum]